MSKDSLDREALAIAYLTGQANAEQVKTYRLLYANDEMFKSTVNEIGKWLAPLNEDVEERPAPDGLLESILSEISEETVNSDTAGLETETMIASPANDRGERKWKWIAAIASAVAIVSISSNVLNSQKPVQNANETLMALLSDSSQPELMAIIYERDTGRVIARLSNIEVPETNDLQLWLIREGEEAPISLGVLDKDKFSNQLEFDISTTLQYETDTLAVSLESLGGSKSAGPEGPVLYTGTVSLLN